MRCIFLKLTEEKETDADGSEHLGNGMKVDRNGFLQLEDGVQETIPFT